jgi:hypothetical protein
MDGGWHLNPNLFQQPLNFGTEPAEIAAMQHVVRAKECLDMGLVVNVNRHANAMKTALILIHAPKTVRTIHHNATKTAPHMIRAPRIVQFPLILAIKHVLNLTGAI